jgi:surfactin family lipopeptide synthetase A
MGDVELRGLAIKPNIVKFDLTLQVTEIENGYGLNLEYCSDLFTENTAVAMLEHFIKLID